MSGQEEQYVQRHHNISLQAVEIINDLCAQPDVFTGLGVSSGALPRHCPPARRLYRLRWLAALRSGPRRPRPAFSTASRARRGSLSQPDDVFTSQPRSSAPRSGSMPQSRTLWVMVFRPPRLFPARPHGQGQQMRWAVRTEDTQDLGVVHVTFVGVDIVSFRFEQAWPHARFRHSKHFMPARYVLEAIDYTRRVKIFKTVCASDGLQHAKPFWHRYFGCCPRSWRPSSTVASWLQKTDCR